MVYLAALPENLPPRESRRAESLLGWGLLLYGLKRLEISPPAGLKAAAVRGSHGKPSLPGLGVEFSIAHSRGLAACAVEDVPVGLDLEQVRMFSPAVVGRICTSGEEVLTAGNDSLLTQLWTCKESHMKLTGRGFSQGFAETEFASLGAKPRLAGSGSACFRSRAVTLAGRSFWLTECCREERPLEIKWVLNPPEQ